VAPGSLPGDARAVKGNPSAGGAGVTRLLGIDYGEVTIGLAVSDETGLIAQGLRALRRQGGGADLETIAGLAHERQVGAIVVGHPKNMDGTIGPSAQAAETFARALGDLTGLPVHLWDERLSTRQAERAMIHAGVRRAKRRAALDVAAATLILQGFLDHRALAAAPHDAGEDAPGDG
jgi:putative Holliday junction resolvase